MTAGDTGKESGKSAAKTSSSKPADRGSKPDRRKTLRWSIVALALIVGVVAWVATQDDDSGNGESEPASSTGFAAKIVSQEELGEIAADSGHPVYWAGPLPGRELEASEAEDGRVTVRYLDEGAEPGSGDPADVLTIGSYPLPDPLGALDGFAEREGSIVRQAEDGRKVVSSTEAPSSVYFASPVGSVQVEVYDPSPARAMSLARSGKVQPVG
jgi:hypothetical protein